MVITKLIGGLGNQMFQYAFARRVAERNRAEFKLDISALQEKYSLVTPRTYALDVFSISASFATIDEIAEIKNGTLPVWMRRLQQRFGFPMTENVFREKHYQFDPASLSLSGDVYCDGYWQSERYFSDIEALIRQDFSFRHTPSEPNEKLLRLIRGSDAVSLHVRRGDYVSDKKTNQYHGVCSPTYYQAAFDRIRETVPMPRLFVFSDDATWAKAHLRFDCPIVFVEGNDGEKSYEDMRLMSECRHHIIANSSFSWWGAWLNPRPEKVVIAPKKWFADERIDTSDLIPSGWVRL